MGIQVEFNPDLALRDYSLCKKGNRKPEECIPDILVVGNEYHFLKKGQRNYWLFGELPLLETKGDGILSKPIASIVIVEVVHFLKDKDVWTKGKYKVIEVFKDKKIHFDGFARI